jgi:arginyl-tRNA synthetase
MAFSARESARSLLTAAVSELASEGIIGAAPASVPIESPRRPEHGDFSSNIALALAKGAGRPPRAVAEAIVARLAVGGGAPLAEATIAGPGFINLRFSPAFWQRAMGTMLAARRCPGFCSNISARTRPGRSTSPMAATPPWATPWRACCALPAIR